MPIADTSWLMRLLNAADPRHAEVREAAKGLTGILLSSLVLGEVLQVVEFETRKLAGALEGRKAARIAFKALSENPAIEVSTDYDVELAGRIFRRQEKLSYVDSVGVALAHRRKTALLSLDDDQAKALRAVP